MLPYDYLKFSYDKLMIKFAQLEIPDCISVKVAFISIIINDKNKLDTVITKN